MMDVDERSKNSTDHAGSDLGKSEVNEPGMADGITDETGLPEQACCPRCGQAISEGQQFCSNCGEKIDMSQKSKHCVKCGASVDPTQKYCPNCGNKMPEVEDTSILTGMSKKEKNKMPRKKLIACGIALIAIVSVICVAVLVVPKIFVSTSEYLARADYSKAYERAKEEDKESVLVENLIAAMAAKAEDSLNDSSSFNLKKAWYNKTNHNIVLSVSGTNKMGGTVTNYICYGVRCQ